MRIYNVQEVSGRMFSEKYERTQLLATFLGTLSFPLLAVWKVWREPGNEARYVWREPGNEASCVWRESGNEASLRTAHKGCVLLSLSLHVPIKRTLAHFHKYS